MDQIKKYPTLGDLAIIVVIFVIVSMVAGILGVLLLRGGVSKEAVMAITYPFAPVAAIVFALYHRHLREGCGSRPSLSLRFKISWLPVLLWGIVLMISVSIVLEPLLMLFPKSWFDFLSDAIGRGGWTVLSTVVLAPILEETLFRGIIQDAAMKKNGAFLGITIGAAMFGIVHIIPMQVINAFFIGLVLGWVYYKTRSLVPVILMHAVNNLISYLLGGVVGADGLPVETIRDWLGIDAIYYAVYGASIVLIIVGVISMRREFAKKEPEMPHPAQ